MIIFRRLKEAMFHNTGTRQTVLKNTVWLFIGQAASRALRAAIVIYAARILGAASWGAFSYALGIATFLTVFSDIGINALLTRETSRNPELKNHYLSTSIFIKLALLAILGGGTLLFLPFLTKIEEAAVLLPFLLLVFAFDSLRDLGSALARALERMEVEAGIQIFTNAVIVALGFIFLFLSPTSRSLAIAYAAGSALGSISMAYTLRHHIKNLMRNFSASLIKPILSTAWPFGLLGIMGIINLNTDIIMLGWMRTPEEVGYYSAAQKLIQILYVIPTLLAVSLFPAMARAVEHNREMVRKLLEKSVTVTILFAIPIAAIGIIFGRAIILAAFGPLYAAAASTFQILMTSILIVFPSSLIGHAIFAYGEQKQFAAFAFTSITFNVILNFALIPLFGIEGAAVSTIITQLVTNIFIWKRMKTLSGFTIIPQLRTYLHL